MSLLREVAEHLARNDVAAALMGAAALPVYGVSRATLDADLVTVDRAVFGAGFWAPLETTTQIDIRKGDQFDPLAGVVRLKRTGERQVDVVVAKYTFVREIIERAEPKMVGGVSLRVVRLADLVLLKLFAGGPQDAWDIHQILAVADENVVAEIENRLPSLPADAQGLWTRIRSERG